MELTNEFVIDRDIEETWTILNDLEFIAPCMPGAQLQEIEGDEYRGIVKIKVGPITAQYKGKASFTEQDATNKVAKLKAEGRDPRQGNASAMVTAKMAPAGEGKTTVNIHTDLGLSGKIASFGRGAIEDVSKKILNQFSENLREKLENDSSAESADVAATSQSSEAAAATPATSTAAPEQVRTGPPAKPPSESAIDSTSSNGVRKIDSLEAEPVDLLAVSSESMMKRLVPAAGGTAIILVILYWLLGRGGA